MHDEGKQGCCWGEERSEMQGMLGTAQDGHGGIAPEAMHLSKCVKEALDLQGWPWAIARAVHSN